MLAGGTAQIGVAWITGEFGHFSFLAISPRSAISWVYLTVIGSIAFAAYAWLLRNAPTPLVATYSYVNPLVAILLGYFIGRETITARILFAAALVICSVALVSAGKSLKATPNEESRISARGKASSNSPQRRF
jgi:drug/metabolite transporter (DMT)-like permease